MNTLIKMRPVTPQPGGPTSADVHPDEVENWLRAGWELAPAAAPAAPEPRPESQPEVKPKVKRSKKAEALVEPGQE